MLTITQVENAIIARLASQLPHLRTCGSLSEFLARDAASIEKLSPSFPAVYVVYRGGKFRHAIGGVQDREMLFEVMVMVTSLRGDPAARQGAADERGAYDLLEEVRAALSGCGCGIDMDPLLPESEEAKAGTRNLAVYSIFFQTRCRGTVAWRE